MTETEIVPIVVAATSKRTLGIKDEDGNWFNMAKDLLADEKKSLATKVDALHSGDAIDLKCDYGTNVYRDLEVRLKSANGNEDEKWAGIAEGKVRHGIALAFIARGHETPTEEVKLKINAWIDFVMAKGKDTQPKPENAENSPKNANNGEIGGFKDDTSTSAIGQKSLMPKIEAKDDTTIPTCPLCETSKNVCKVKDHYVCRTCGERMPVKKGEQL